MRRHSDAEPAARPAGHDPELDAALRFRLTADDLLSDLLWPKLFRVPALALRPGRIGLGVVAILLIVFVDTLLALIVGGVPLIEIVRASVLDGLAAGLHTATLDVGGVLLAGASSIALAATELWREAPARTLIVVPIALVVHGLAGVAIGRMSAEEFSLGRLPSWTEGLAWSVRSVAAVLLAHLVPLLVVGLIIGIVSVGALALLSVPFLNVVGAVAGVLAVGLAFVSVVLLLVYALGFGMLSPAIACEGSDGIDAMQRVYAQVIGRPGRWAVYSLVLVLQFVVVSSVAFAIAALTTALAVFSMSLWLGHDASLVASGVGGGSLGAGGQAAARVMQTVLTLPAILASGYLYAYCFAGWTVQHLLLRRALDGQDVTDIYVPGAVQARVDEVMSRRSAEDPTG